MNAEEVQSVKRRFEIVGNAPQLNYAIEVAVQVAPTDMSVLITGESGSGKESFSKIIHQLSARKHGSFIVVNCGAIPEGTIDSELFGHEKGAFTGAADARKGYFEVTDGGTIFLDEIGEMPLGTQARLLRVLETGDFMRVGSSKPQRSDVRVVAATNVNLLEAVQKGRFREDLYYRLNTVPIYVPPLRERGTDPELLFRKFAGDFGERYRVQPIRLDDEAKALLLSYDFPGNIRQLRNLVEQMSVLEMERDVTAAVLRKYLPKSPPRLPALLRDVQADPQFTERELLYKVLFDMKKDMSELKALVFRLLQSDDNGHEVLKRHGDLFDEMSGHDFERSTEPTTEPMLKPFLLEAARNSRPVPKNTNLRYDRVEDVVHEPEDESLRLEEKEREMIIKALRKHNHRRKHAAQDLGISERTLYRKIKQYEIENE